MLCEEGVLDALGDSPHLSLTSKRTLARVNRATRQGINNYLHRDHLWVHQSDRTIANARWLIRAAEANAALCIHVFDAPGFESKGDDDKPMGHLGFCVAMSKNEPAPDPLTGLPRSGALFVASQTEHEQQHATRVRGVATDAATNAANAASTALIPAGEGPSASESSSDEEEEDEALKNAAILDATVAWFLGHMLASIARTDVGIRTTNGSEVNISDLAGADRLYHCLGPATRHGLKDTDWAFMDGALFLNAMRRVDLLGPVRVETGRGRQGVETGRGTAIRAANRTARFVRLRLNDDAMTYVGAKLRRSVVTRNVTTLDFHGNDFGALGTSAIFCTRPNLNRPNLFWDKPDVHYMRLQRLVFDFTPIGDGFGLQWVIDAMIQKLLPQLEYLRLVGTRMTSNNAYRLFDALGTTQAAPKLYSLNVSNNPFTGGAFESMRKESWSHANLSSLKACFVKNVDALGFSWLARAILNNKLPNIKDVIYIGSAPDTAYCVGAAMSAHRAMRGAEIAIKRAERPPSPPPAKCKPRKGLHPNSPNESDSDFESGNGGGPAGIHLQPPAPGDTSSEEESDDDDNDDDDEEEESPEEDIMDDEEDDFVGVDAD